MVRHRCRTVLILIAAICIIMAGSPCVAQRVLVVTPEQSVPAQYPRSNGEFVVTDLVAAGLPFDLVTYSRFVSMPLGIHDVIILNGHTSPVPVADVAAKCQTAIGEGRKVFINGRWPYQRYQTNGALAETVNYSFTLFNASDGGKRYVYGSPVLPTTIEKDPSITSVAISYSLYTWTFASPPPITVTIGGRIIGFLCSTGGAIEGSAENLTTVLDYGKVVNYLRNGDPMIVGFANDRIGGKPVVAWEVHCHEPGNPSAIQRLDDLSRDLNMPLANLITYNALSSAGIAKWNSLTNPLMIIGSHSRTHPNSWPALPSVLYETSEVIAAQKAVIPATTNYLNFSGAMDPTTAQIDQIHAAGVSFGAGGTDGRGYRLASGQYVEIQKVPTRRIWMTNLAKSTTMPFCPSQTLDSDWATWTANKDFSVEIQRQFLQNVKYGLYSYGYFHDTMYDPDLNYYVNGVHLSAQIRAAMDYLHSRDVVFLSADQLIARLQDYIAGSITSTTNPDGSLTVVVSRPGSLANQIKVGWKNGLAPVASGESVLSQQLAGEALYVSLRPETTSTVQIGWASIPPMAPVVSTEYAYISYESLIQWEVPLYPSGVAEYQYAVGTSPMGTDVCDWVSAGTALSTTLSGVPLIDGETHYVSVRAKYTGGDWSPVGVSPPLVADVTAPSCSVTDEGSMQRSNDHLDVQWTAEDPESGVLEVQYAIGTSPGTCDAEAWTPAVGNDLQITGLQLQTGRNYYVTVRARNGANTWGQASTDGIRIEVIESIGMTLNYDDYTDANLSRVVVTAVFPDECYIEDRDRTAGTRVTGLPPSINENDELTLDGAFETDGPVRTWRAGDNCTVTGSCVLKPLFLSNLLMGGASSAGRPGPTNGVGVNNVGMLVTVAGKVTEKAAGYVRISDGSLSAGDRVKVKVSSIPPNLDVGSYVLATGISSLEEVGGDYKRLLLTRRSSDLVVMLP